MHSCMFVGIINNNNYNNSNNNKDNLYGAVTLQYCYIHSFIHTEHLYSASSRKLLRGAPDSSTAKKSSLKL